MAASAHVRSTSWPQDLDPLSKTIEDHLSTLQQKPESSYYNKLGVLKNLFDVVEIFLRFQTTKSRKAFADFDGFLEVLDICCTIRDVLMQIKEHVRELESSLRRRVITREDQGAFLAREIDVCKRRALSRTISKQLKKKKSYGEEVNLVKKVEEVSYNVLVSLLVEIVANNERDYKQRSRSGGLGMFSRMFSKKNQEVDGEELKKLRETEDKIEETERELECVYKKLLKTRVSLLNMLNI